MKSSASKPASSPGRTDKYPPPLMRFLRSNVASKSRRSRATPLFTRRKRSTIDAEKEPSSPKVTCIGQVKIRRSSSKSKHPSTRDPRPTPTPLRRRPSSNSGAGAGNGSLFCFWLGKPPAISCCRRRRGRPSCFKAIWRKWVSFFCCKKTRVRTDSVKNGSNPPGSGLIYSDSDSFEITRHRFEYKESEEEDEEEESSGRVNGSDTSTTTPPKNAFFLTRCRSAPHRSSILASQNWGSPLKTEQDKKVEQENIEINSLEIEQMKAAESRIDREGEGNLEICKEDARDSESVGCLDKTETTQKADEKETNEEVKIVVLTRCKSEPARRSGDPLTSSFWREKRFESTVSCRNSVETKKENIV